MSGGGADITCHLAPDICCRLTYLYNTSVAPIIVAALPVIGINRGVDNS